MEFHTYKSEICHYVKRVGDLRAIDELSSSNDIVNKFEEKDYLKGFYLLGMLDYLCKKHDMEYVTRFSELRKYKLKNRVYPSYTSIMYSLHKDPKVFDECLKHAEYEFLKFNIVEGEIENVA